MGYLNVSVEVNLHQYPPIQELAMKNIKEVTLPDLHGNVLKLLNLLIRYQIVTGIDKNDYWELVKICKKSLEYSHFPKYLSKLDKSMWSQDLEKFKDIINKIKIKNYIKIRLIGDELADRGYNDYFTLFLLKKLVKEGGNLEILISNHTDEFIKNYEEKSETEGYSNSAIKDARSMKSMQYLISQGLLKRDEIDNIVSFVYKKSLKAISYTLSADKKKITIYSHAPIGLAEIKKLADSLKIDTTAIKEPQLISTKPKLPHAQELANIIDKINEAFQTLFENKSIHFLMEKNNKFCKAFQMIIWNRNYLIIHRPAKISFIHGHDPNDPHVIGNLEYNNTLGKLTEEEGKIVEHHRGIYNFIVVKSNKFDFQNKNQVDESIVKDSEDTINNLPTGINPFPQKVVSVPSKLTPSYVTTLDDWIAENDGKKSFLSNQSMPTLIGQITYGSKHVSNNPIKNELPNNSIDKNEESKNQDIQENSVGAKIPRGIKPNSTPFNSPREITSIFFSSKHNKISTFDDEISNRNKYDSKTCRAKI